MFARTLARVVSSTAAATGSLTESTTTRNVTTKGIRKPSKVAEQIRVSRRKRARRERGRDIHTKTEHLKATMASTRNARDVVLAQLADQIFSKGHKHMGSAMNVTYVPDGNPATPLVALAGRGRVGKTSLLRSLFRSSSEVGCSNRQLRRDAMNYFNVGDVFNVVDLPGYGGTSVPWATVLQHAVLLRNFAQFQPSLKMLYYCMDVHHKHGVYVQDMDILKFLSREVPNFTIVLTKAEQLSSNPHESGGFRLEDVRKELLFNEIHHPVIVTSAYRMGGVDTLRFDMVMNCLHALPTERLTYTEAKRLSERLFSQKELATVRHLPIPPTQLDDEVREWNAQLQRERELRLEASAPGEVETAEASSPPSMAASGEKVGHPTAVPGGGIDGHDEFEVNVGDIKAAVQASEEEEAKSALASLSVHSLEATALRALSDPDKQAAYLSMAKKVRNEGLMRYVKDTSPWRNPLLWPENVVPTKHPKSNLMRCPEDPANPYLSQPSFVAPRADMYFRRPNVGLRMSSQKGRYEADRPLAYLLKSYTIPFFPDIVDTEMHPAPWTFLGSREAYYERSGGRQLGVRLLQHVTKEAVNPLRDNPAPDSPQLTQELRTLEQRRYGAPIAMLRPPGMEEKALNSSEGVGGVRSLLETSTDGVTPAS